MPDTRDTFDDERLMRYLIGSLDETETERLDELSITDDKFAERLRIVEDEMLDAYATGQLAREMRAGFENHYLKLPGKQDRVRFAVALASRRGQAAGGKSSEPLAETGRRSLAQRLLWPLVAAASIAIAVFGYALLQRSTEPARSTQPPSAVSTEPPPAERGTDTAGATATPARPVPVAIVLMPATRRAAEPPTLSIPPGVPTVEASLVLEADDFPTYSVALKDAGSDRVVWKDADFKASSSATGRIVIVSIASELLKAKHYTLDLSGVRASGRSEVITSYPFRVTTK